MSKYKCDFCEGDFQLGPQVYEGKFIPKHKLHLCDGCYTINRRGVLHNYVAQFKNHLDKNNIAPPEVNTEGFYILE